MICIPVVALTIVFTNFDLAAQTFFTISNTTYIHNITGLTSQPIYTCPPPVGQAYYDMAIDTNQHLYWITGDGGLYRRKLSDSLSCEYLGTFNAATTSLVADINGDVYAAGGLLLKYDPHTNVFQNLGYIGTALGDLFFYKGELYVVSSCPGSYQSIVKVNICQPEMSNCYITLPGSFNDTYAAFSIESAAISRAYIIRLDGKIYELNMEARTVGNFVGNLPVGPSGAASIYGFSPGPTSDTSICSNQLPYTWNNHSYSTAGVYTQTLLSSYGCDSVVTLNLAVKEIPSFNLGIDTTICNGSTLQLNAGTGNVNYLWQDGSANPGYIVKRPGTYWVNIFKDGCSSSDSITVNFKNCNCSLVIPNAITPNGDGINDTWIIPQTSCFSLVNIFVYNRYGSLVFSKYNYQNDWKGTYRLKDLPDGTYYYIVNAVEMNSSIQTFKGNITILR